MTRTRKIASARRFASQIEAAGLAETIFNPNISWNFHIF
jgi:hypothetical protein